MVSSSDDAQRADPWRGHLWKGCHGFQRLKRGNFGFENGCSTFHNLDRSNFSLEFSVLLCNGCRGCYILLTSVDLDVYVERYTSFILLYVKPSKQHDGFLSVYTAKARIWWVDAGTISHPSALQCTGRRLLHDLLLVDMEYSTTSPKPIVQTTKIDSSDLELPQGRRTHDTWLDGNIKVCFLEYAWWFRLEDVFQSDKLCVAGTLRQELC